jgi:hypothetical protein
MINLWALIAVAASIVAVILFYACLAVADANKLLRAANDDLVAAGNELIVCMDALEVRCEWLERQAAYTSDARAGNVLMIVARMHGDAEMVAEGEAP